MTRVNRQNLIPTPNLLKSLGCLLPVSEFGSLLIVLGVLGVSRWGSEGTALRVLSIIAIVIGVLLVIPMLVMIGMQMMLRRAVNRLGEVLQEGASALGEQMVQHNKEIFESIHEYRAAEESDFEGLDRAFYEQATAALVERDCQLMGDVVNATLEKIKNVRPVLRRFITPDGKASVTIYHLVTPEGQKLQRGRELKICELCTEFEDGSFLTTANTGDLAALTPPDQLTKISLPLESSPVEVLERHLAELETIANKTPLILTTLADILASLQRQNGVVMAHRKQIGYIDPEEVRRIAMNSGKDEASADRAAQAADEARQSEIEDPE